MSQLKRRLAATALILCGGLLLLPASGQAAQVFGSDLLQQPNQPDCAMLGPCTVAAFVEVPAEGQLSTVGAPIDGVITKFRIRAKVESPIQVTFRVANVSPVFSAEEPVRAKAAHAVGSGTGPTVTLQVAGDEAPPQEFPGRLPVRKGQHLALDGPAGLVATHDANGDKFSYEFAPPLADGSAERLSNEFLGELLVQGTLEPDADHDGFGDETQDGCPSQASTQGACDRAKPVIAKLHVRKGKVSYRLSEASTVSLRLSKKNGRKFKAVGRAFTGPGKAGANHRGLPHASKLGPGAYRLAISATDAAANTAAAKTVFRIKG